MKFLEQIRFCLWTNFPFLPVYKGKNNRRNANLHKQILNYLSKREKSDEEAAVFAWLKNNWLKVFPYDYIQGYNSQSVKVYKDENNKNYVMLENKKLYFKANMNEQMIKECFNSLLLEQDKLSPHNYRVDDVEQNMIVADIGAAEGIFSLTIIERVKKIYIFECDPEWIEALHLTFAPWKDKVIIVNKYIGYENKSGYTTLDKYFADKEIDYIKADIEGAEYDMLEGGVETLKSKVRKVVVCTYHKGDDEVKIGNFLRGINYNIEPSKGFMIFTQDEFLQEPFLRRGVIFGRNNEFR